MRALVHHACGDTCLEEVPDRVLQDDTDAVVRVDASTTCGTDLHLPNGDVTTIGPGGAGSPANACVDAHRSVTHHVRQDQVLEAHDTFGRAAATGALAVVVGR